MIVILNRCYDEESGHVVYILNPPEQMCIQIKVKAYGIATFLI